MNDLPASPRSKSAARAWAWAGGVWLALCLAGAGATFALQPPDAPSPRDSGGSRDTGDLRDSRQGGVPRPAETSAGCERAAAEARRRAQREGSESYAYLCLESGDAPAASGPR